MSRRKILIRVGIFTALVLIALIVFDLIRPRPAINQATADQIEPGMTEAEVDLVVGAPAGNHHPIFPLKPHMKIRAPLDGAAKRKSWTGKQGILMVWIDTEGRVMKVWFVPFPR